MTNSFRTKIVSLGRITIPKPVRERLKLKPGDFVEVSDIKKLVVQEAGSGG